MEHVCRLIHSREALQAGYTGKGITAAVIDTGIGPHPDIPYDRVRMFRDFINLKRMPYDDSGHGTHVCGILAGSGRLAGGRWCGVAPECTLVVLKALDHRGDGEPSCVMAAMKWLLERKEELGVRVLNLSFGASYDELDDEYYRLLDMIKKVWESGICVVGAAGNLGPAPGTITVPGCSRNMVTVGASERGKFANQYSGRGPTREGVKKPDLVAPAGGITSLAPLPHDIRGRLVRFFPGRQFSTGGLWTQAEWNQVMSNRAIKSRLFRSGYLKKSGTSMSTPMVTGAICLLLQKEPGLNPEEIRKRLWQSSVDLGLPEEQQGHGIIDIRMLLELK